MKKKVIGISISILLIALTFSGCFDNDNKPPEDSSLIQIKNNFINFVNNVTSYKFNKTGGANIIIIDGAITDVSEILSNTTFKADISKKSLELVTNYTNVGLNLNYGLLVYIKDGYKYTGKMQSGNISWEIDELSSASAVSNWIMFSNLNQYFDQMTNEIPQQDKNVTWKLLEDESFDNKTYYYALQRELIINFTDPNYAGYDLLKSYQKFLINKTNYELYKVKIDQIQEITGDFTGGIDRRYMLSQDIFTFYDYNIPLKIELPPELIK